MQAEDIWLTQAPGICPLCSKPLTGRGMSQSQPTIVTCLSCGFSAPFVQGRHREDQPLEGKAALARQSSSSSSVWIDPAVSAFLGERVVDAGFPLPGAGNALTQQAFPPSHAAQSPQSGPVTPIPPSASPPRQTKNVKVRPKYRRSQREPLEDDDVTRIPTLPPPPMWQYESPDFEAGSSLSALSLVVDVPTRPETTLSPRTTRNLSHIDELDTVPPILLLPLPSGNTLAVAPAKMPGRVEHKKPASSRRGEAPSGSTVPGDQAKIDDPSSWTAGGAARSAYAQRIAERSKRNRRKHTYSFNPLDRLRWWLLHPGRIEFILWLGGTMLLLCVTFVLLLVTAVSLSWVTPGLQNGRGVNSLLNGSSPANNSKGTSTTTVTTAGLTITLLNTAPLVPGQPIHLRGQGFTPHGNVTFTDERERPMLASNTQSSSFQTDSNGVFIVTLNDSPWTPGHHQVVVRDVTSGRVAKLPVVLVASLSSKKGPPPPAVTSQPGVTPTSNTGAGGPTPVSSTPVSTPTVGVTPKPSPTATQTQITPTPSPSGVTPTATPAITPTVGVTPTSTTGSSAKNSGAQYMAASVADTSLHVYNNLDSWIWLLIVGYIISMLMLGIAGILRKHQR